MFVIVAHKIAYLANLLKIAPTAELDLLLKTHLVSNVYQGVANAIQQ